MLSNATTVTGATLGAAVGAVIAYVVEITARIDVPTQIEYAIVIIATAVVAALWAPGQ